MKALFTITLLCFSLALAPSNNLFAKDKDASLLFGFLPSRSTISLFRHYKPLTDYLSDELNRKVIIETAADYPSFLQKTDQRQYDFVLTAPHFALMAIDTGKYLDAAAYNNGLMADILVKQSSSITRLEQLANKTISIPPESAIISMAAKYYLRSKGLTSPLAPRFLVTNSHYDSVHTMLSGETDAAIVSFNVTRLFERKKAPIRKIARTDELPGMVILAARDLPGDLRLTFSKVLIDMKNTPEGRAALNKMGYPGYRRLKQRELEAARPYIKMHMEMTQAREQNK